MKHKDFEIIDNIKCYAPGLAHENTDYPREVYNFLVKAEEKNFWFISRNKVIQHFFEKYTGRGAADILEIGCGTGFVLRGLRERFLQYRLTGSEIHLEGIRFAKARLPEVEFIQMDATSMPFEENFDAIGAFDVLEHIEEDEKVLREVHRGLRPGGYFFISVPQYQWMWSITDDLAFHKRRYHRNELCSKLEEAGFNVQYLGAFVFTLFPIMYLSRLLKRHKQMDDSPLQGKNKSELNELMLSPLVNGIFRAFMRLDEWLIIKGISLPYGGSLLAVAQKNKAP